MGKHDKAIAHYRKQQRLDREDLRDYEAGRREEFEFRGTARVNVTRQTIEALKSAIASAGRLIAAYRKRND